METPRGTVWGITPDLWPPEQTLQAVRAALEHGVDRVILRERRLTARAQHRLMANLLDAGIEAHRVLLRLGPTDLS